MWHVFLMFGFMYHAQANMVVKCKTPKCVMAVVHNAQRDPNITGYRVYQPGDGPYELNEGHWLPTINERKA